MDDVDDNGVTMGDGDDDGDDVDDDKDVGGKSHLIESAGVSSASLLY